MTQAIIIQNPKWEPFSKVSDAFKAAKAPAVLVVRGRCKEKKVPKISLIKSGKTAAAVAALLFACVLGASAQMSIINNLSQTTVAGSTTNSGIGAGYIALNIDQVAVIQQTIVTTNGGAGLTNTVTKTLDTSDNGTDWVADQYSIVTLLNGTNAATSITRITNTVGAKYLRFGKDRNTNTNAVQTLRLTLSIKEQ